MDIDIAVAVTVSMLLWRDASPGVKFPKTKEVVKIELGRILGHRNLHREFPWLRSVLGSAMLLTLDAEPWDVHPQSLMASYIRKIPQEQREHLGRAIRETTYEDPTFSIIVRQGKPSTATADDIITLSQDVMTALGVGVDATPHVERGVRDRYFGLFEQLSR